MQFATHPRKLCTMTSNEQNLRDRLQTVAQTAPPKLARFAQWAQSHLDDIAFLSIRRIAEAAEVNANLAPRLAQALGYEGFNDLRAEVQSIVQGRNHSYGTRARALSGREGAGVYSELIAAGLKNFEAATSPASLSEIDACVEILLNARRIYTVGVRSCFSVAHYFSYVGSMAFDSFVEMPSMPGAILDQMCRLGPEDAVVAISYDHYSAEVVRACQVAHHCGAKIIALTDAISSPVARGASRAIVLPMAGPQLMPSLVSALLVLEMILAAMASRGEKVAERIEDFERRISDYGGYQTSAPPRKHAR